MMLSSFDKIRHSLFSTVSISQVLLLLIASTAFAHVVGYLVRWCPLSSGSGIPQIQSEMLGILDMNPVKIIVAKFIGGGLGNLSGLSLGREGPSIQIGGACGDRKSTRLNSSHAHISYAV